MRMPLNNKIADRINRMRQSKRKIVFFIPPMKMVNGGILSIFSLCKTSREFHNIHKSDVVLSVYPGHKTYGRNDLFENQETIYTFEDILGDETPDFLMLHIPETASAEALNYLQANHFEKLRKIPDLRINILNQNIVLMHPPLDVARWFTLTPTVTQTTAHNRYSTQELSDKYCLPTHHLSTFVDHKQYEFIDYDAKDDIILLSPDLVSEKNKIVKSIKDKMPDYEIITVENMAYEDYKSLASRAKYLITFGEGFDGYYVEGFFSGGVTFAVYNDTFFPSSRFQGLPNIFSSYESMLDTITARIQSMEKDTKIYSGTVKKNLDEINKLYSFESYRNNLKNYYLGKYTYIPQMKSAGQLIGKLLVDRDKTISELTARVNYQHKEIQDLLTLVNYERDKVQGFLNSKSWKVTSPLRKLSERFKLN
jgi:hypothetical protein